MMTMNLDRERRSWWTMVTFSLKSTNNLCIISRLIFFFCTDARPCLRVVGLCCCRRSPLLSSPVEVFFFSSSSSLMKKMRNLHEICKTSKRARKSTSASVDRPNERGEKWSSMSRQAAAVQCLVYRIYGSRQGRTVKIVCELKCTYVGFGV